jgi:hypothetical protein
VSISVVCKLKAVKPTASILKVPICGKLKILLLFTIPIPVVFLYCRIWQELFFEVSGNSFFEKSTGNPFSLKRGAVVGLLAPSQRYSTIEEEEACWLWPENKWLLEKVKEGVVVVPKRKLQA